MYLKPLPPITLVSNHRYTECVAKATPMLERYAAYKHGGEVHWVRAVERIAAEQRRGAPTGEQQSGAPTGGSDRRLYVLAIHPGFTARYSKCVHEADGVLQQARRQAFHTPCPQTLTLSPGDTHLRRRGI